MTKLSFKTVLTCLLCLCIGGTVATVYFQTQYGLSREWIPLTKPESNRRGIGYSFESLFASDISLPEVTSISGKAKLVEGTDAAGFGVGYVTEVSINPLDLSKVPEEYKEDRVEMIDGHEVKALGITQVTFQATLTFLLKDADGFVLKEVVSESHFIESGKTNRLQSIAPGSISNSLASRVKAIDVKLNIEKCVICRNQ